MLTLCVSQTTDVVYGVQLKVLFMRVPGKKNKVAMWEGDIPPNLQQCLAEVMWIFSVQKEILHPSCRVTNTLNSQGNGVVQALTCKEPKGCYLIIQKMVSKFPSKI